IVTVFTPDANKDGRAHAEALKKAHDAIEIRDSTDDAQTAFADTLDDLVTASGAFGNPLGLPLAVLEATPALDTMAVIYSGDGGWRDIDK
ncbi:AcvB/VirJ family lysyl-phosphatidylglycerol hydrolase, partial [Rhizobium ruizarguesonis]